MAEGRDQGFKSAERSAIQGHELSESHPDGQSRIQNQGHVAIVGGGAVGRMLAYFLQAIDLTPIVYGRRGVERIDQKILLRGVTRSLVTTGEESEPELWLFATKAYDLSSALDQWLPHISPDISAVLLCNGFLEPSLRGIRQRFAQHTLLKGIVARGARTSADGTIVVSDSGHIIWGGSQTPTPIEQKLFGALRSEGFHWDGDVCRLRKEKWFCNAVLNTLSGAYQLSRNGDAPLLPEYKELCHEVFRLGLHYWPEWQGQNANLEMLLHELISKTSDNENSMAVDVRLGRRTEADFLAGLVSHFPDARTRFPLLSRLHARIIAMGTQDRPTTD